MKIVITTGLIFIISLLSFQEVVVYLGFKINQDFIAANFCVEKDIKESDCKGSCCLSKMVSNTKERPSSDIPIPVFEPVKVDLFLQSLKFSELSSIDLVSDLFADFRLKGSEYHQILLRPPIT